MATVPPWINIKKVSHVSDPYTETLRPGAPMTSQREGPTGEGHHYQYVGPYRIEKTLGKGQTDSKEIDT
ncbi:hypothetical protein CEXT_288801 [Caerostris extrusa]|uniref:Uncharacterized protein n=1 Tax=Caerostris extrusa TaxID=172846 RepID=A0AAV4VCT8_CAEEX|nr:hypothetical protein CEXT_288801 [Caerostris extrusa]